MLRVKRRELVCLGFAALIAAGLEFHSELAGAPASINADAYGLALYGYDPVAYMTDGKPMQGDPAITTVHDGATYRLASAANHDAFMAEPANYLPAYGWLLRP